MYRYIKIKTYDKNLNSTIIIVTSNFLFTYWLVFHSMKIFSFTFQILSLWQYPVWGKPIPSTAWPWTPQGQFWCLGPQRTPWRCMTPGTVWPVSWSWKVTQTMSGPWWSAKMAHRWVVATIINVIMQGFSFLLMVRFSNTLIQVIYSLFLSFIHSFFLSISFTVYPISLFYLDNLLSDFTYWV